MRSAQVRAVQVPESGPDLVVRVAAHEVGHAVVWSAVGLDVDEVVVPGGCFDAVGDAYCELVWPIDLDTHIDAYLIGMMGGAAAEQRHLQRLGCDSHCAGRAVAESTVHDLGCFHRLSREHRGRLSVEQALARAVRLVDAHAAQLDALVVELARTRRLPGHAVTAAVRQAPGRTGASLAHCRDDVAAAWPAAVVRAVDRRAEVSRGEPPLHRRRGRARPGRALELPALPCPAAMNDPTGMNDPTAHRPAENGPASHTCPGGCGRSVSRRMFACPGCWGDLPRHLQTAITRHHRRDNVMHAQAMTTALAWYRDQRKPITDTEDGTP